MELKISTQFSRFVSGLNCDNRCISYVNGAIFTIVPGKILFFLSPSSKLKAEEHWCDLDGKRHFGAIYYAELFVDLGIRTVVRLEDADNEENAVFEQYGSAVCTLEDLGCTDPSERFSLQTISRFVEVCRHARGPVAVCGDDRLACTLLTAYMLRSGLFADAAEAVSWICIARGAAVAPDYSLLRPAGGRKLSREAQSLMDLGTPSRTI
jgi:hypothetical protein